MHERCLRTVNSEKTSSLENLLEKDGSVTIQLEFANSCDRNVQNWQEFITISNSRPFPFQQDNYNLRHNSYFARPNVASVYHGIASLSNLEPRTWNLVSNELKQLVDVYASKYCPCRLCKTYIPNVGFI